MQLNTKTGTMRLTKTELRQLKTASEICRTLQKIAHFADESKAGKEAADQLDYLVDQFTPDPDKEETKDA